MQVQHDKHQYFFEKYLRKEMMPEELALFESRLEEDELFRNDFNRYRLHRQEILRDELAAYDEPELLLKKPQRWGWVYAVLSLLCIVLVADYFFSEHYAAEVEGKKTREPFIEKINPFQFLGSKEDKTPSVRTDKKTTEEPIIENIADSTLKADSLSADILPYLEGNRMALVGDYFVSDSLFVVLAQEEVLQSKVARAKGIDTLNQDSALNHRLISDFLSENEINGQQLLVEFWDSPIHFRGYMFNGKKLVLYDLDKEPELIVVSYKKGRYYHLFVNGLEYPLISDSVIHQLSE